MKKIIQNLVIFSAVMVGSMFLVIEKSNAQTGNYCACIDNNTQFYSCQQASNGCSMITGFSCQPTLFPTRTACDDEIRQLNNSGRGNQNTPTESTQTQASTGGLASKILPECVLKNTLDENCKDVSIFLELMFQIINYLFGIIGGVALLFFVYGGFVFILSEGSPEKVSKGKSIIVAAILGIIISFSGYALVKFVGKVVGIDQSYQLLE